MNSTLAPPLKRFYELDGSHIENWPDFVSAINAFLPGSPWQGNSLDALDDVLSGGYGTPDRFVVVWKDSEASRRALGYEATARFYERLPEFEALYQAGTLKTLFETVVEIFQGHEHVELRLE